MLNFYLGVKILNILIIYENGDSKKIFLVKMLPKRYQKLLNYRD